MAITKASGANFIDRTGQRFGRWLVIERAHAIKKVRWFCLCDCGTMRSVAAADLQSGKTNSCGCLARDRKGQTIRKLNRREYNSWMGMKQRCFYQKHIEYHRYGGRGITTCEAWRADFSTFLKDMGPCPPEMSLDRIDTNGPYSPSNCRWATKEQQSENTSRNVNVEYGGRFWTLKQLAEHLGVNYFRLHAYFRRRGLELKEAIEKAQAPGIIRPYRRKPEILTP